MIRAWWQKVRDYWPSPRILRDGIPDDPVAAVTNWTDSFPYFCANMATKTQGGEFCASLS